MPGFRSLESFIRGLISASPSNTRGRSPVPELGTPGSVRGVLSNGHPYRNPRPVAVDRRTTLVQPYGKLLIRSNFSRSTRHLWTSLALPVMYCAAWYED